MDFSICCDIFTLIKIVISIWYLLISLIFFRGNVRLDPLVSSMSRYESFLRASNVLVSGNGSGQLDTSLHRASIIAGEHSSPRGRKNRDSGSGSDSRGRSRGRASALVAFSTTETATLAGDEDVPGISSFLAACLTANFISVGYLFVPYGKLSLFLPRLF
jgi:hypothetical protein